MVNPAEYGHKAIWRIAAPMMLSGISVPLLGLVDTAVMGHLEGPQYLAAVAIGATIFSLLFMSLNFLRMGTTGLTAQAYGANDPDKQIAGLQQPLSVALGIAILLIIFHSPLLNLALLLLGPSSEVAELARQYFSIRILSAPFALANFVVIGWLLGMQNARGPLAITLILNITNMILDIVFVVGLGMTIEGVALATLISEILAMLVAWFFVARTLKRAGINRSFFTWQQGEKLQRLLAVNGSLFLRTVTLMFTFSFMTAQGARIGDVTLATNALLMNLLLLLSYALDGIAHAAEALTGKAFGQRSQFHIEEAVSQTLMWSLVFAAIFSLVYFVAGPLIVNTMTNIPDIRDNANIYLPWLVALPAAAVASFLYDGVFVGLTKTREMCIVMMLSTFLVFLPSWYLTQRWDNHGLWFALILFMALRSLGMHGWYRYLKSKNQLLMSNTPRH
jgi:MATE family multidrug resistance protein